MISLILLTLVLAVLTAAVIQIFKLYGGKAKSSIYVNNTVAKILAIGIVATVAISTVAAIKSLAYSPLNADYSDKFTFENIATATGIAAMLICLLLNALQRGAYWIVRLSSSVINDKQLHIRQKVFETSYRIGALLIAVSILWLDTKLWQIPSIIANEHGSVPGHLSWIGINLVVTLFALPLIVGAFKSTETSK